MEAPKSIPTIYDKRDPLVILSLFFLALQTAPEQILCFPARRGKTPARRSSSSRWSLARRSSSSQQSHARRASCELAHSQGEAACAAGQRARAAIAARAATEMGSGTTSRHRARRFLPPPHPSTTAASSCAAPLSLPSSPHCWSSTAAAEYPILQRRCLSPPPSTVAASSRAGSGRPELGLVRRGRRSPALVAMPALVGRGLEAGRSST